tara:strand:- start:4175 stop:4342 length:168 start_codon:yes stop_codon:yes gene_type:complete
MAAIKTWQIIQETTMGWTKIDEPNCTGLTKEQCKVRLEQLMNEGFNPNDLKAVPD